MSSAEANRTVRFLTIIQSVSELSAHVFEHLAGWPIGCIRNGRFHGVDNLAHDRPILGAQVARQALLDCELDLGTDQPGADSKELCRLIVSRPFHRLPALVPPSFRQVIEKAPTERCPAA